MSTNLFGLIEGFYTLQDSTLEAISVDLGGSVTATDLKFIRSILAVAGKPVSLSELRLCAELLKSSVRLMDADVISGVKSHDKSITDMFASFAEGYARVSGNRTSLPVNALFEYAVTGKAPGKAGGFTFIGQSPQNTSHA